MNNILIISFSFLNSDPRVDRQIRFLSPRYNVIVAGYAPPQIEGITFIPIKMVSSCFFKRFLALLKLIFRQYESYYFSKIEIIETIQNLQKFDFDLIITNDIDTLPLTISISKGRKIIFDAHEYAPRELEDRLMFRLLFQGYKSYLCKKYIPKVDKMVTVCQSIADEYAKDTGIKSMIITNAPSYQELTPKLIEDNFGKIRLVHHGGAAISRKIENMIKMMDYLDGRFSLTFMLVESSKNYIFHLKKLANNNPKIIFLEPVPMRTLPQYLNQFDIGLFLLEPTNFNYLNALPNKLFEFIQARLAIAIGPSPEMAKIVKEYDLGIIADDFEPKSLAKKLMKLDYEKINYYKNQSHKAARTLSAESNKQILLNLVKETLNTP